MRVIKPPTVRRWMREHPDAAVSLDGWLRTARKKTWKSFHELRAAMPNADMVRVRSGGPVVVFDIAFNRYRLIAGVHFNRGIVYVLRFLTHKEYDREQWKADL